MNSRTAMFTQFEVALGPKSCDVAGNVSVIVGNFIDGSEVSKFEEFKRSVEAHNRTDKPWIGSTIIAEMG